MNYEQNAEKEFLNRISNTDLLDNIFGYAYKRSFSKYEAEELCSEIILELFISLKNNNTIINLNAFIWQVAHNAYCDYVARQKKLYNKNDELPVESAYDCSFEDSVLEKLMEEKQLSWIKREITFLAKIYREVMIMFYIDEMSIKDIAVKLEIPENRVKQRLFSAKEKIRKGAAIMNTSKEIKMLKPYKLFLHGSGSFQFGDPTNEVKRLLSQNIIISCRDKAKTALELAEEFNIPTIFMEDELKVLSGGMLKNLGNGKYISDSIIIDMELQDKINSKIEKIAKELGATIKTYMDAKINDFENINFLNYPKPASSILWNIIPMLADNVCFNLSDKIVTELKDAGNEPEIKHFYVLGEIYPLDSPIEHAFYGLNGTKAVNMFGYNEILIDNYIGKRLPWECGRFGALENLNYNLELAMIIRSIGGVDISIFNEDEKETIAKAISKGYIVKVNDKIYPNVIVMDGSAREKVNNIICGADNITDEFAEKLLTEYRILVKKYVPKHLLGQARMFIESTINVLRHYLIEECINNGLLNIPDYNCCSEGISVVVK